MVLYKYLQFFAKSDDPEFDKVHTAGSVPPHSGIYRCEGCGHEVVAERARTLPPQNHHQHQPSQGAIRWRLIAWA